MNPLPDSHLSLLDKPHKAEWPWTTAIPEWPGTMSDGRSWPRITIVTPSYNQGQYLEETIRSVLLQGYPNLEYIIIDGGSSDNSVEIIRKYEPWLTYWESCKDRGQSHAINKGFARSTGDIMAWLNSDDVYQPGALQQVALQFVDRQKTMLIGASIITDGPSELSGDVDRRQPTWEEMIYDARSFPQPSVFWTRDLWDLAGLLDEELYFAMDYALWLQMRLRAECEIILDDVLSIARSHPDQKGVTAKREGWLYKFTQQRAIIAVRAAVARGEHPLIWLYQIWSRRIISAFTRRKFSLIFGSSFHREATRIVIRNILWRE